MQRRRGHSDKLRRDCDGYESVISRHVAIFEPGNDEVQATAMFKCVSPGSVLGPGCIGIIEALFDHRPPSESGEVWCFFVQS